MSNWIDPLKSEMQKEFGDKPSIATLATVQLSKSGPCADARSVVVRTIFDDGKLLIVSDARSNKNNQLKANPSATVVFWFSKLRTQFRIGGQVQILSTDSTDPIYAQAWQNLSDASRALFYWPHTHRIVSDESDFVKKVPATEAIPKSFEALVLTPERVDILDLNLHPHRRVKWQLNSGAWLSTPADP